MDSKNTPQEKIHFEYLREEDLDELVSMIKASMMENDSHNKDVFDKDYWLWNYTGLEGGQTLVYVAKNHAGKIVGHYHFIILDGKYPDGSTKYTLIQDAGVDPAYRNMGIFKTISLKGKADLEERGVKIIETFPNVRSKHSFSKNTQYSIIGMIPSFVQVYDGTYLASAKAPMKGLGKILGSMASGLLSLARFYTPPKGSRVEVDQMLSEELLDVYRDFSSTFSYGLTKDRNYVQWRFLDKPGYEHYFAKIYDAEDRLMALAVMKPDTIMGVRCLVMVDMAHRPDQEKFFLHLLTQVRKRHQEFFGEKLGLLYTSVNGQIGKKLWKAGLISLPKKVNPRVIPLMVSNTEEVDGFYDPARWQVCLCDWDVL